MQGLQQQRQMNNHQQASGSHSTPQPFSKNEIEELFPKVNKPAVARTPSVPADTSGPNGDRYYPQQQGWGQQQNQGLRVS